MPRFLIVPGLVILLAGRLGPLLGKLGLSRQPGGAIIERENFTLYSRWRPACCSA